jgi:hypothetical protein
MAENALPEQYNMVYTLGVQPGIKRDGTTFEAREYSDGEWCRFQRGVPKKMGGYRELFSTFNGIARGMIASPYNGVNYIFTGNANGIDVFTTGTTYGVGSGPFSAVIQSGYSTFNINTVLTSSFKITTSPAKDLTYLFPAGTKLIFNGNASVVYTVLSSSYASPNTTVTLTTTISGSPTTVSLYNYPFTPDLRLLWQFDIQYSVLGGSLQVLAHPGLNLYNIDNGIPTQVLVGNVLPDANETWTFSGLADTGGQNPTYLPIVVDGGVCVLYPYVFVYGSNGFIANNHVSSVYNQQTITDWNGATANQANMSASKIVKGVPVRGGTNSPSGLFWALDSLIRVSATGAAPLYWRYDIVSSQISIMSSSSVVEMDGTFYWMGVDRFYQYNGQVSVLANDKNVNWLFDNLNFEQRQKVWATKVPRYNEIWFFYPRGTATECTDAIIYNVKDKIWYDAGSAVGAQRSCGYTTEVFPTPIWCDWNFTAVYSQPFNVISRPTTSPPTPAPTAYQFYTAGDTTSTFSPGDYLTFSNTPGDKVYKIVSSDFTFNAAVTAVVPTGITLVTVDVVINPAVTAGAVVYNIQGGFPLWQHEFGLNRVSFNAETSVTSNFTTCDISWVGGTPSQDTSSGVNRRMHLRRIEPDFVQNGTMTLNILGNKFARGDTETSGPFYFEPETGKIDMRVEYREIKLKFESDVIDGNYEMGRLLITSEYGDERP